MNRNQSATLNLDAELRENERREPQHVAGAKPISLWIALAVLTAVLTGLTFYGYRTLQKENIRLNEIAEALHSLGSLSGRLRAAESQIVDWGARFNDLTDRLSKIDRKLNAGLQGVRKHAEELNAALETRIQDQIDERDYLVDARFRDLESQMQVERTQLAQLREELARTQQQIATVRQATDREFAGLKQRADENKREVSSLAQRLDHRRVDFELVKRRVYAPVPEISLKVTRTAPRYQRYSGWVFFLPDRRTFWVDDQGVQQPVVFYSRQNGERYEVVMTAVTRFSVFGYVLLPSGAIPEGRQSASSAPELPGAPTPSL